MPVVSFSFKVLSKLKTFYSDENSANFVSIKEAQQIHKQIEQITIYVLLKFWEDFPHFTLRK